MLAPIATKPSEKIPYAEFLCQTCLICIKFGLNCVSDTRWYLVLPLHAVETLDAFSSGTWSGNKKGFGKRQRYPFMQYAAIVQELAFV